MAVQNQIYNFEIFEKFPQKNLIKVFKPVFSLYTFLQLLKKVGRGPTIIKDIQRKLQFRV